MCKSNACQTQVKCISNASQMQVKCKSNASQIANLQIMWNSSEFIESHVQINAATLSGSVNYFLGEGITHLFQKYLETS